MDKRAQEAWLAFWEQDLSPLSADYMAGIEDLPVQEREFEKAELGSSTICAAERRERQKAVDFARASIGLEGFNVSDEIEASARRFINGEIGLEEFVKPRISSIRKG
jgi:hypothetical protein